MDKVTLSIQTVNQIMAYLGRQSFQDVFQLIEAIQKEAQAQQPAPEQPAPDAPAE